MTTPKPARQRQRHHDQQAPGNGRQPRPRPRLRYTPPRTALRAVVALAAVALSLYWLGTSADPGDALVLVQRTDLLPLVVAVALLVGSLAAKALRWRAMLPAGTRLSRREAYRIFHVSILLNNLLPFRLGDGSRVLAASVQRNVSTPQAVLVLLFERLLDALFLAAVALLVLPLFSTVEVPEVLDEMAEAATAPVTGFTAGAVGLVLLITVLALRRLHPGHRVTAWLGRLGSDLRTVSSMGPAAASRLIAWTFAAWLGTFLLHYILLGAVGLDGTFLLAIVITLATNLGMLIPATPANVGVFHVAAAAPLLATGAPAELSVAYAVVLHAVNTAPPIAVGAVCLVAPWLAAVSRRRERHARGGC